MQSTKTEVCELCGGKDGFHQMVMFEEPVYLNEPHRAMTGMERCLNSYKPKDEDYYGD